MPAPTERRRKSKTARPKWKSIAEKVTLPGARPATFKLAGKALDSFDLYRSSRKIGTARVEPDGEWTARFEDPEGRWVAGASSGGDLLRLVGAYLLGTEVRARQARPLKEVHPELRIEGRMTEEQKLSAKLIGRSRDARLAQLDDLLARLKQQIRPAPKA